MYVNTMTDDWNLENTSASAEEKAEVEAGAQWAVCPACGDLNELDAAFWAAVALAGCQETPVRCGSCGAVYSVEIAAIPGTQEAEPASMCEQLAGENHNIRNSER